MIASEHQMSKLAGRAVRIYMKTAGEYSVWATVGKVGTSDFRVIDPTWNTADREMPRGLLRRTLAGGYKVRFCDVERVEIDPLMDAAPLLKVTYCILGCHCGTDGCDLAYVSGVKGGELSGPEYLAWAIGVVYGIEENRIHVGEVSWESADEMDRRIRGARSWYARGVHGAEIRRTVILHHQYAALSRGSIQDCV